MNEATDHVIQVIHSEISQALNRHIEELRHVFSNEIEFSVSYHNGKLRIHGVIAGCDTGESSVDFAAMLLAGVELGMDATGSSRGEYLQDLVMCLHRAIDQISEQIPFGHSLSK